MAHDVFVSYASQDKAVADALCAAVEQRGIRCWMAPRDILPGHNYGEAIIEAINASRLMVMVFSSHSNQSPQVMREVERAVSKGLPIIPFRVEDVAPSKAMEYFISAPHWLEALTPPLERHIARAVEMIGLLLTHTVGQAPDEGPPALPARRPSQARVVLGGRQTRYVGLLVLTIMVVAAVVFGLRELPSSTLTQKETSASSAHRSELDRLLSEGRDRINEVRGVIPLSHESQGAASEELGRLMAQRDAAVKALAVFERRLADLDEEWRQHTPGTLDEQERQRLRVGTAFSTPVEGRDWATWEGEAHRLAATWEQERTRADRQRQAAIAELRAKLNEAAQAILAAMEAARSGYELQDPRFQELATLRERLLAHMNGLLTLRGQLDARIAATGEASEELHQRIPATTAELTEEARAMEAKARELTVVVLAAATTEADRLRRSAALFKLAHEEAMWYVCNDAQGRPIYIDSPAERERLTSDGRAPFLFDDPDHKVLLTTQGEIRFSVLLPHAGSLGHHYTFTSRGPYGLGNVQTSAHSGRFLMHAAGIRLEHLPWRKETESDRQRATKESEMRASLADLLNHRPKLQGLALKPEDVTVEFDPISIDFTVSNRGMAEFGQRVARWICNGFRINLRPMADQLPSGLLGQGGQAYAAQVQHLIQAWAGTPATSPPTSTAPAEERIR